MHPEALQIRPRLCIETLSVCKGLRIQTLGVQARLCTETLGVCKGLRIQTLGVQARLGVQMLGVLSHVRDKTFGVFTRLGAQTLGVLTRVRNKAFDVFTRLGAQTLGVQARLGVPMFITRAGSADLLSQVLTQSLKVSFELLVQPLHASSLWPSFARATRKSYPETDDCPREWPLASHPGAPQRRHSSACCPHTLPMDNILGGGGAVKARSVLFQGFVVLVLVLLMIVFSEHGFRASQEGLRLFFDVVLPSLLPFFIVSDLLLAYGVVHFLGELFEPLMRPLFNVPGAGSFVLSMGLAAGYPMDAVITAKFRRQGMCTRAEGERMLAFSNTADPLFIFGAVAVGMFGMPALGLTLAAAHYLGALLVGLTFRGWARQEDLAARPSVAAPSKGIWRRALSAMLAARREDTRPLGVVLQDAIRDSVATLFLIMSFIVLFSVLIRVLDATGAMTFLLWPIRALLPLAGLAPSLAHSLLQGLMEIDIGTAAAAKAQASLLQQAVVVSAIIGWSGLSVQAQVAAVLADSDIRMRPYVLARVLHALYAAVLTVFLLPLLQGGTVQALVTGGGAAQPVGFEHFLGAGLLLAGLGAAAPIVVGIVVTALRQLRIVRLRV